MDMKGNILSKVGEKCMMKSIIICIHHILLGN
jgi:hypothetical protein